MLNINYVQKDFNIGVEYFKSTKDYLFWDATYDDPLMFYSTRGTGQRFYGNYNLTDGFQIRLGHMIAKPKYDSTFLGEPKEITDSRQFSASYLEFVSRL